MHTCAYTRKENNLTVTAQLRVSLISSYTKVYSLIVDESTNTLNYPAIHALIFLSVTTLFCRRLDLTINYLFHNELKLKVTQASALAVQRYSYTLARQTTVYGQTAAAQNTTQFSAKTLSYGISRWNASSLIHLRVYQTWLCVNHICLLEAQSNHEHPGIHVEFCRMYRNNIDLLHVTTYH